MEVFLESRRVHLALKNAKIRSETTGEYGEGGD